MKLQECRTAFKVINLNSKINKYFKKLIRFTFIDTFVIHYEFNVELKIKTVVASQEVAESCEERASGKSFEVEGMQQNIPGSFEVFVSNVVVDCILIIKSLFKCFDFTTDTLKV